MQRQEMSGYPPELRALCQAYQRGDINRRDFFERVKKFAVGGLTATAILEALGAQVVAARETSQRDAVTASDIRRADDLRSTAILRHGAYVCLSVPPGARGGAAAAAVPGLADRLGFRNEFLPGDNQETCAFLRRVDATPHDIADDYLLRADAVVHAAAETTAPVDEFCAEISRLLGPSVTTRILSGVVRPLKYTGNAMHNFGYAHRVLQQSGVTMPNAFLVPMSKTAAWWQKGWMERHTYFLPRYDDSGHIVSEGHALAAATGIACLMRRTYWHSAEPAPAGAYDFVSYFECADADVPTFHDVCAALRDVKRNPEWAFVREGPTWQGRRVATWADLFA